VFAEELRRRAAGIAALSGEQVALLEAHYELLLHWNRKLNLTTVLGLEEAVERHYCESLFLASRLPAGPLSIADIGSGPGFPGFPVAVLRPECTVTLVESHQRKAVFLREASRSVRNVRVLAKRAEDVSEAFDWVISRAVSYRDLATNLKRLACNAALLTGAEEPPSKLEFQWEPAVTLPWGDTRILRIGHTETA
jgi:16S rRNA (guanine(527)-N(7))-methyltransferase RsmG